MTSTSKVPLQVEKKVLDLLVEGRHGDPHAVLGAHPHDGRVTVRVLRPLAESVVVVHGGERVRLEHEHEGIWAGVLEVAEPPDYRLEVTYPGGHAHTVDDACLHGAFPVERTVTGAQDLRLLFVVVVRAAGHVEDAAITGTVLRHLLAERVGIPRTATLRRRAGGLAGLRAGKRRAVETRHRAAEEKPIERVVECRRLT